MLSHHEGERGVYDELGLYCIMLLQSFDGYLSSKQNVVFDSYYHHVVFDRRSPCEGSYDAQ